MHVTTSSSPNSSGGTISTTKSPLPVPEETSGASGSITTIAIGAGVAGALVVALLVIIIVLFVRRRKNRKLQRQHLAFQRSNAAGYPSLQPRFVELTKTAASESPSPASTLGRASMRTRFKPGGPSRWEVSRSYVDVCDDVVLGEGAFGKVCLGHLLEPLVASSAAEEDTLVAIKEVKCE